MDREERRVYYDSELQLEAYHLTGVVQPFPNHFHPYYVVGFVEAGRRHLRCGGRTYEPGPGDLILFNPEESHWCAPVDGEPLDYRAVNLSPEAMGQAARETTGRDGLPRFTQTVAPRSELTAALGALFDAVVGRAPLLGREHPDVVGQAVTDASGQAHLGIITFPVPVLRADREQLQVLRRRLYDPDFRELTVADFSDVVQSCQTCEVFLDKAAHTEEAALRCYGLGLCGRKKLVNKLTGSLPLLR